MRCSRPSTFVLVADSGERDEDDDDLAPGGAVVADATEAGAGTYRVTSWKPPLACSSAKNLDGPSGRSKACRSARRMDHDWAPILPTPPPPPLLCDGVRTWSLPLLLGPCASPLARPCPPFSSRNMSFSCFTVTWWDVHSCSTAIAKPCCSGLRHGSRHSRRSMSDGWVDVQTARFRMLAGPAHKRCRSANTSVCTAPLVWRSKASNTGNASPFRSRGWRTVDGSPSNAITITAASNPRGRRFPHADVTAVTNTSYPGAL